MITTFLVNFVKHIELDLDEVGIISPYKDQIYAIKKKFNKLYYENVIKKKPEIATVDSF